MNTVPPKSSPQTNRPGSAIVFLMTGPATNAAAFMTIWSVLGRRTAITYAITVAGGAIAAGLLLDRIVQATAGQVVSGMGTMLPPVVKNVSAVILLAVLAYAILPAKKKSKLDTKEGIGK